MKHNHFSHFLAAAMLCTSSQLWASETLIVSNANGETTTFLLSSHPDVSFSDQSVILHTDDQKVFYPIDQYLSFSYGKDETDINDVKSDGEVFSFNGGVQARGLKPSEEIYIYNINGQIITQGKANDVGCAEILFDTNRVKVFLVKTATKTFKVISSKKDK